MLPAEISTFLIGMTPVGEIRAAIPFGIAKFGLSSVESFFWGFLGNLFVTILIIFLLDPITAFARKNLPPADRLLQKIFTKTRAKHSQSFLRWGSAFLVIFVAIPLPGSGAYTGSLVAWLFGIKPKHAILLIALGIFFAGLIVLGITNGSLAFAKLL